MLPPASSLLALPMRTRKTPTVSLTFELEALVDNKVASGGYRSAREVVQAALRLLDEREQRMERKLQTLSDPLHAG